MPSQRSDTVQSFSRGLDVLRSFAGRRRQSISDVAVNAAMTRAAARRFLHTLCAEGLARTDGKHFELTPAVLEIGAVWLSGASEMEAVREVLFDLTRETGESASAAILEGADVIYVARAPARHRVMTIGLAVGARLPAHATALGQSLLARLPARELEQFLALSRLQKLTPRTITTRTELKRRLDQVTQQGYALVSDELEPGLRSIAVAVEGPETHMRVALNLSAQAARYGEAEMVERFLPALRRAARLAAMSGSR